MKKKSLGQLIGELEELGVERHPNGHVSFNRRTLVLKDARHSYMARYPVRSVPSVKRSVSWLIAAVDSLTWLAENDASTIGERLQYEALKIKIEAIIEQYPNARL